MSRKMEEEILMAIGSQAVYYNEIFEKMVDLTEGNWTQYNEEDFIESVQSLKDKDHINYHDYTTGKETNIFSLSKRGTSRYARLLKREGLI